MKKCHFLLVSAALVLYTGAAFAEVHEDTTPANGIDVISYHKNPDGTTNWQFVVGDINGFTDSTTKKQIYGSRVGSTGDIGNQSTTLTLKATAFLPCYLEMNIKMNGRQTELRSWDEGTAASNSPEDANLPWIDFNPAMGGYVNNNWELINNTFNAKNEVQPGPNVFIRACDQMMTTIYSNLDYKYALSLTNGALLRDSQSSSNNGSETKTDTTKDTDKLPVYYRYKSATQQATTDSTGSTPVNLDSATWSTAITTITEPGVDLISQAYATYYTSILQEFKVPYDRTRKAGNYTSTLKAVATTL